MRTFLTSALIALTAAVALRAGAAQQPTFRTGTQSVRVDLYATKDGKPVLDLRRDEVEVFEDGIRQNVETFERISFSARTAEPIVQPRSIDDSRDMASDPRSRLFVVFVPMRDPRVRTEPLVQARYPLNQQFKSQLWADDHVAVKTPYNRISDLTFQRRLSHCSSAS